MVITIHFQSESDLQWLNKIVAILKKAAVRFEVKGVPAENSPHLKNSREAFLQKVPLSGVITTPIQIPDRESRNAR
jgi:phosphoribosylcarboxyaminoimidazole (NCAIR) mutase